MIEHMSSHPDLARGRLNTAQARKTYNKMWADLTEKLNSAGLGQKSIEKWQKSWSDYKQNLKKKVSEIERSRKLTGGGPGSDKVLTDFELKVLGILGESFYKGVGVEEIGLSLPSRNIEQITDFETDISWVNHSEVEDDMVNSLAELKSLPSTSKQTLTRDVYLTGTKTVQLKADVEKSGKIPFRKRPCSASIYRETQEDHDYLANITATSNTPRKKPRNRSTEEEYNKIYAETVEVLHNINNNVNAVAQRLEELTQEIRSCAEILKLLVEKLGVNKDKI